ncbi:hypothetical protein [Aeromonas sp. ASNIH3]|jgi:predicted transcriptional regulator|nr:hypothetical protein [Aeromonas sp. ASNIH3]
MYPKNVTSTRDNIIDSEKLDIFIVLKFNSAMNIYEAEIKKQNTRFILSKKVVEKGPSNAKSNMGELMKKRLLVM